MPLHINELVSEVTVTDSATGRSAQRSPGTPAADGIAMLRRREDIAARTAANGMDD
jgi:hypothetical protein